MEKLFNFKFQNKKSILILLAIGIITTSFSFKSSGFPAEIVNPDLNSRITNLTYSIIEKKIFNQVDTLTKDKRSSRREILKANADKIPAVDKPSGIDKNGENYYDMVEFPAVPPGGIEGWGQYLSSNLKYPELARKNDISGTVIAVFIVKNDGTVSDVEILRGIGGGCDEETVRVIENSPTWTAGKIKTGEAVNTRMRLPVRFN